jgi:hypothetical protein
MPALMVCCAVLGRCQPRNIWPLTTMSGGRPVTSVQGLYERMTLEAFQSGLSWTTVLRKRENFRRAFAGFDPGRVAAFTEDDVARRYPKPRQNYGSHRNARLVVDLGPKFSELVLGYRGRPPAAGWTLVGVAVLLLGVAFLLDRWSLVGVPFLLFGVAAPLSGVAAWLDGWTLVGVALLARSRHCCLGSRSCWTDGHRPGSHSCCPESRRSLGLGSWCRC